MDRLERQDRGKGFPVDGQHRAGEWWEPGGWAPAVRLLTLTLPEMERSG